MCFSLHLQLVVRLYTLHPAVHGHHITAGVHVEYDFWRRRWWCVCVCVCTQVCLFTPQHRHPVARMAVIFSVWFSPLGKWRENKSWVCMSHAEYTDRKLFSFYERNSLRWPKHPVTIPADWNLTATSAIPLWKWKSCQKNLNYLKNYLDFEAFIRRHMKDSAAVSYSYLYCYIVHCS